MEDFASRFSKEAKEALFKSERIAHSLKEQLGSNHLLLAIATMKESKAYVVLDELGISLSALNSVFQFSPKKEEKKGLPSQEIKEILKQSFTLAFQSRSGEISTIHLLLATLQNRQFSANLLLRKIGVDLEKLKRMLFQRLEEEKNFKDTNIPEEERGGFLDSGEFGFLDFPFPSFFSQGSPKRAKTKSKTPTLDLFATDLTKKAKKGEIDPVIGREKEIQRVIQILNRRKKNNPVLIGEPGVGKTAIVEGLAQKITLGQVPFSLANKRVLALDLGLLVAGTKYRGEFEKRIKKIVEEIKRDKDVILFIDEIHTVVGAGAAEGSIDAANIIKPPLARGELRLIGATTLDEYRKHIEKDSAFERRLQPVLIEEPTPAETLDILKGIKDYYEKFHRVKITQDALKSAVEFSQKYIHDRFFPDKAIDLIDEAASAKGVKVQTDIPSRKIARLEKQLEKIVKQKEKAVNRQDFEKAALFKDKEEKLKKEIEDFKKGATRKKILGRITRKDIAVVVSQWTGIPVGELAIEERKKYQRLEERMKSKIIGQDQAIHEVARAIKRSSAGVRAEDRPIGSFIFLGPTGVGKTETAKVLAEVLFGSKDALIKIDMSEFMEKHNVSRLVGAPPGYVGYEEGGKLTEQVRRKPYSVILFDEIEKAHPEVFNMLLQVLEDGYLTDAQGRRVSFKNTVIIMTSNLGVKELNQEAEIGFRLVQKQGDKQGFLKRFTSAKRKIMKEVKSFFPPEFLNRLDKIIIFNPLSVADVKEIVKIQLKELQQRLKQKKIFLEADSSALRFLAKKGFDPHLGARPIRRLITREIEDRVSEKLLLGEIKEGDKIKTTLSSNKKHLTLNLRRKSKQRI